MRANRTFSGLFVLASLACASSRPYRGDISLRRASDTLGSPYTFGVEKGRIVSPELDVAIGKDGCARGLAGVDSFLLCPTSPGVIAPLAAGEVATRWNGEGGDFVTRISPDRKLLRVDGRVRIRRDEDVHTTLVLQSGPQWDVLRKNPVLLALAAAAVGIVSDQPPAAADCSAPDRQRSAAFQQSCSATASSQPLVRPEAATSAPSPAATTDRAPAPSPRPAFSASSPPVAIKTGNTH